MLKKQDVQPSLKVRIRRLFLYLFLTFLGILLIFIILVMNNISKSLENESELFSSLVNSIIESDPESIKTLAQDYSLWDDMYYYVQSQNKEFENKYLNINYFQKFGIEFVGVYSFEKPVFISSVNHSLNFFLANMKIDINSASHFFEMPPGSSFPIEIYAYPIARTVDVKRSNPIGIFVVGRLLDIEEILKLEKKTASKITFETKYRKTKNTFNETITFSKAFKNSKGEVIGYLVCEKTSLVFRSVLMNAIFLTLAFSTLFLVFMLILGPSIVKSVILPLHDIEYSIKNNTPDSVEKYIYQSDEVGELARAIKQYLIQREQINVYLKELESKNASLRALNEEVRRLLEKDVLTGLLTRYVFNSQIERLYVTSKVDRIPLSAIAIDADNFKKINDTFGHAIGDEVLKKIGEVILRNIRMSDFPIRMGGEEILILLPEADINAAYSIAERIRRKVEEEFQNLPYKATISLGVTQLRGDDTIETFLRRADDALYISKSNGKNQTSML